MDDSEKIRRVGFRKWYDRELLNGHANLLLLVFASVGLLGCLEVYSTRASLADRVQLLAGALACAAIGYFALRRYLRALTHAEFVARQAGCASCGAHGKWNAVDEPGSHARLRVRCRRCAHTWDIRL